MAIPVQTADPAGDGSIIKYTWNLTTADPIGDALAFPAWADRCFTLTGTWGGATAAIQGSNGSNYVTLTNGATGESATTTVDSVITPFEGVLYVRPNLTVVGVGASVTVIIIARRSSPLRT
ncbi:MAG: hypothetical protein IPN69_08570 [Acidobacteria bacterium]|nr:hypothetical protein [Acidobacteriota bacterium]